MATLDEIARELGISSATVSRALNYRPGVNPQTRQRVLDLARRLNYAPRPSARLLAQGEPLPGAGAPGTDMAGTDTFAFITCEQPVPPENDPFYPQIMRGVQQELARHGYFTLVSSVYPNLDDACALPLIRERRVGGVILAGPFYAPQFVRSLKSAGLPLVLVDNVSAQPPVDAVLVDDESAAYEATRHLIERHGHRRVVALGGPPAWVSSRARAAGYRRAMSEAGLAPCVILETETTSASGYRAMQRAFTEYPGAGAVFTANDVMAIGAMRAAQEHGCRLPDDLALIGFDDIELASHTVPALTTVHVPKRQMGVMAARRLLNLVAGEDEAAVVSLVAARLVLRSSCGCS